VRTRDYELVMVISPAADEGRMQGIVERVHRLITQSGGNLTRHEAWGRRRLAYPIRRYTEGTYVYTRFTAPVQVSREVERVLRSTEDVLRHLLVKVE
jgi:small subunit ribosomal protein S6